MDILKILNRKKYLFERDINNHNNQLAYIVSNSRFLVIGGAGTIGHQVVKEIFKRQPKLLHVVDINENNIVELVRDLRSSLGYIKGDFATFALDCGSKEFVAFLNAHVEYDYVLNFSALKHVRNEQDPFTLMRMLNVNIFNALKIIKLNKKKCINKYFSISTDKATNPVNMMGASKLIMEMFLMRESETQKLSMARFANVAFSDGSLLHGFNQRILKHQPISAPSDVERYFITPKESGELCLLSSLLGENRDIFFPKLNNNLKLTKFSDIAESYLLQKGYEPFLCQSENEARSKCEDLIKKKKWPCYFFKSDTTGEKDFEEFYTSTEILDMESFKGLGVIKNTLSYENKRLDLFEKGVNRLIERNNWSKNEILNLFNEILPNFNHLETGKYLDQKM